MSGVLPASGSVVFVDANIFIYSVTADATYGSVCEKVLNRIEVGELIGHTSAAVLDDVSHRLLMIEAMNAFGWPAAGVLRKLKRQPELIKSLVSSLTAISEIVHSNIQIHSILASTVLRSRELSKIHGLLSNDALILAVMEEQSLSMLVSIDSDFDRVPSVTRLSPL